MEFKQRPHCLDCYAYYHGKVCPRCGEGVAHGIKAMDKTWHKACFTCALCHESLSSFVEQGGRPYHEKCLRSQETAAVPEKDPANAWQLMGSESHTCHTCKRTVPLGEGVSIKAPHQLGAGIGGRYYFHDACFTCQSCRKDLKGQYVLSDGAFWCEHCAGQQSKKPVQAAPCAKCGKGLEGKISRALGKEWHASCFGCHKCGRSFPNGEFYDVDGKPHCEKCA